jgi:hypothetical protein
VPPGDALYWAREYGSLYDSREREQDQHRKLIRLLYDLTNPHGCADVTCCAPIPDDHPLYPVLRWAIETTTPDD